MKITTVVRMAGQHAINLKHKSKISKKSRLLRFNIVVMKHGWCTIIDNMNGEKNITYMYVPSRKYIIL
jgi:hypothetical protein